MPSPKAEGAVSLPKERASTQRASGFKEAAHSITFCGPRCSKSYSVGGIWFRSVKAVRIDAALWKADLPSRCHSFVVVPVRWIV